jgi:hypothetical protein
MSGRQHCEVTMSEMQQQVHGQFKIFAGPLAPDGSLGSLGDQLSTFVSERKVSAKSIGVEYVESAKRLVLTLGYREGSEWSPVTIQHLALGRVTGLVDRTDFSGLERALAAAADSIKGIICHEVYVTEDQEFHVIFMVTAA